MSHQWTLAQAFAHRAREHAGRTVLVDGAGRWSHARSAARPSVRDGGAGELHGPELAGEVAVHGPTAMSASARMAGESARSLSPDGGLDGGDHGAADEEGRPRAAGRGEVTILRGGCVCHPRDVVDRPRARTVPVAGAVVTGGETQDSAPDTMAGHKVPDRVRLFDTFPEPGTGR